MKNPYFSYKVESEKLLWEDIVIESIQMMGEDIYYLPRTLVNVDSIFQDDISSQFDKSYMIEVYPENIDGFDGDGDLFSKFGIEIRDQMTFVMAKRRWKLVSSRGTNKIVENSRPMEGDLIYFPMSKSIFEIAKVEHEQPFYQLKNITVYKLQCNIFEYNSEQFDTGIDFIDSVEDNAAYNLTITTDNLFDYSIFSNHKATVFRQIQPGGKIITAEITSASGKDKTINLTHISGNGESEFMQIRETIDDEPATFNVEDEDGNVLASGTIISTKAKDDDYSQNDDFRNEVEDILDFNENNPFGRF